MSILLAKLNKLMKTPSRRRKKNFFDLLDLIEKFEDSYYQLNGSTPHSVLLHLMEARI